MRQDVHVVAPVEVEIDPARQGVQEPCPGAEAKNPAEQGRHLLEPGGAYVPARQGTQAPALGICPAGQELPHPALPMIGDTAPSVLAGQAAQTLAPALLEKVCAGQGLQLLEPGVGLKEPGGQGRQIGSALVAKVPARQVVHAPLPVALLVPGAQGVQVEEPTVSACVPGGHGKQAPGPTRSLKVLTGQRLQKVCFSLSWKRPTGHPVHIADLLSGVMNPCSQSMQEGCPVRRFAVPGGHGVHPTDPPRENVPVGQAVHCVARG